MTHRIADRRAIVQVRWGPMAYRKAVLEPGQVLRVGRSEATGLALPHDSRLEEEHFELAWDGSRCRIRDLRTSAGTLLDGKPIKEGVVPHGGWIRAGGTDFVTYVERYTPADTAGDESGSVADSEGRSKALSLLGSQDGLYAVLDAARDARILTLLRESVEEHHSLYEGPKGVALAEVAPYLVRLPRESMLLNSLVEEGWGKAWGVFLTSNASFTDTRRHFRKFLMIELEGAEGRFYFRFYDPRVLSQFLPTCASQQKADFFGPVSSFMCETLVEDTHSLTVHPA
ncbi:DUF4123 domain-containing protein [Hyalangium versicolor]|uniref:DUF4123 domain-containing protein n=1 Tax=Hyalangium versicolor TaxID=2861190 RepID=UPI001CCB10DD|nr:DUF4123 domain-containing protein [Hyalangium versicolor]